MPSDQRVLITGAGGFIGGRIAEVLHGSGCAQVRAGVRRWAGAARIGRLPVEIVPCDLADARQVDAACDGVTAVVQCASVTGPESEAPLRNLLEAAHRRGVTRVVHLSTTEVYGAVAGDVDEEHPLGPAQSDYARAKIAAERVCAEYVARGLPIVILRPTIVYGPFSEVWTVKFVQRLLSGRWSLPEESCRGTCNLLYVDDLVAAIVLALRTGEFSLYGRAAFYVTGKAQRMLGYQPTFTMASGITSSVAWLRHEGYLGNGGPAAAFGTKK